MFLARNSGPQAMARIRRAHPTGLFVAVKSKHITVQFVVPKFSFEFLLKPTRHAIKNISALGESQMRRHTGCGFFGAIYVGLHLAEGDRRRGQRAVTIEDGVVRIFPSLLRQSLFSLGLILNKAVFIFVSVG